MFATVNALHFLFLALAIIAAYNVARIPKIRRVIGRHAEIPAGVPSYRCSYGIRRPAKLRVGFPFGRVTIVEGGIVLSSLFGTLQFAVDEGATFAPMATPGLGGFDRISIRHGDMEGEVWVRDRAVFEAILAATTSGGRRPHDHPTRTHPRPPER